VNSFATRISESVFQFSNCCRSHKAEWNRSIAAGKSEAVMFLQNHRTIKKKRQFHFCFRTCNPTKHQSARSDRAGSIRPARHAGARLASTATTRTLPAADKNMRGSRGETSYSRSAMKRLPRKASSNPAPIDGAAFPRLCPSSKRADDTGPEICPGGQDPRKYRDTHPPGKLSAEP
jgi:hypothetical protein